MSATSPDPRRAAETAVNWDSLAQALAIGISGLVLVAWAIRATRLVLYPWDWSPDEGLELDYARRVITAPATLYSHTIVPYPCNYTPLLPLLLAPFAFLSSAPLLPARILQAVFAAVTVTAAARLVRRRAPLALAVAAATLWLAPFNLSFWLMLVRIDGLMFALWIAAALPLMPETLAAGGDRLTTPRLVAGSALLMLAVLAKQTAVLHGAPLVVGWWLVDRRSATRLAGVLTAAGILAFLVLQVATHGGFLWVMRLFAYHGFVPGQEHEIVTFFVSQTLPVILAALAGFVAAAVAGRRPWADGSVLLIVGGLGALPTIGKSGAMWNYLLPLLLALCVAAGRWWGAALRDRPPLAAYAALAASTAALWLAATRPFPVPGPGAAVTASAFYGHVREVTRPAGTRILAAFPTYASFVAGYPVEVETGTLPFLADANVAGVDVIRKRLQDGAYALVIAGPFFPPSGGGLAEAFASRYEAYGGCRVFYFWGPTPLTFYAPRGTAVDYRPPSGSGCGFLRKPS